MTLTASLSYIVQHVIRIFCISVNLCLQKMMFLNIQFIKQTTYEYSTASHPIIAQSHNYLSLICHSLNCTEEQTLQSSPSQHRLQVGQFSLRTSIVLHLINYTNAKCQWQLQLVLSIIGGGLLAQSLLGFVTEIR